MDGQQQHRACSISFLMSIESAQPYKRGKGTPPDSLSCKFSRSTVSFFCWWSLPLLSHQRRSSASSQIWTLQFSSRSICLVTAYSKSLRYCSWIFDNDRLPKQPQAILVIADGRDSTRIMAKNRASSGGHRLFWCSFQHLNSKLKLALFIRQKSNWVEFVRHRLNEVHRDSVVST